MRKTWLRCARSDVLASLVEDLERWPRRLTSVELARLLGVSGPTARALLLAAGLAQPGRWCYADPRVIADVLRGRLAELGDERATTLPKGPPVPARYAPGAWRRGRRRPRDVEATQARLTELGQWLTPKETAAALDVSLVTLSAWRRRRDLAPGSATWPPYHQGRALLPSSAREPATGLARPGAGHSRRGQHPPVLYDRNELLAWLAG